MDLNLTMRYVMVQAQKEASGGSAKAEHLFLGLLALSKKTASELTQDARMQLRIESDMQAVKRLFEIKRVHVEDAQDKLRFLLTIEPQKAETDASDLLLQAMEACKKQGKTEVTAYSTLDLLLKSPTGLIGKALKAAPLAGDSGQESETALAPPLFPPADPAVSENGNVQETVLVQELSIEPTPRPVQPQPPKSQPAQLQPPEQKPTVKQTPELYPPVQQPEVVIFDIPKPGAAGNQKPQNQPGTPGLQGGQNQLGDAALYHALQNLRNQTIVDQLPPERPDHDIGQPNKPVNLPPIYQPKIKTRINGLTFSGNVGWAAVKYFWWALVMPAIALLVLESQWNLISAPASNKWIAGIPYAIAVLGLYLGIFGIVSLVRRRFKAFAVFFNFLASIVYIASAMVIYLRLYNKEALSTFEMVFVWIAVLCIFIYALTSLGSLKNVSAGASYSLNTAMFRIGGTPSIIFFSFMMRTLFLPLFTCGVLMIFNLPFTAAWKAIFSIYGFLWTWSIIRMIFKCNSLRFRTNTLPFRKWNFWYAQCNMLLLPALGLFLMGYFGWFPMKTWLIWVYAIYGSFWFLMTITLLLPVKQ